MSTLRKRVLCGVVVGMVVLPAMGARKRDRSAPTTQATQPANPSPSAGGATTQATNQPATQATSPQATGSQAGRAVAGAVARPVRAATSPKVMGLIRRLASDDWKSRQAAVDALVAMGEDVLLDLVPALEKAVDPEVRTRLESAIARIEEDRLIGGSLITLKLDGVPAAKAVEEISRRARAPILLEPAGLLQGKSAKKVSLNVDHRPFWEVMSLVCRQAEVEPACITRQGREMGMGLVRANGAKEWDDRPVVLAGPLLIRADTISRTSSISLRDGGDSANEFSLTLTAFAEPKLKVLDYSGTIHLDEVVDEKGNSLVPPEDNGVPANLETFGNSRGGFPSQWALGATLAYPKNAGKTITRLKGSASFEVQIRAARLELPIHSAKNVSVRLDGVRLLVKSVDGARADLSVFRDGRGDAEWLRLRTLVSQAEAQVVDDKGQVISRTQNGVDADESNDSQRMDLKLRLMRDGEDGSEGKTAREGRKKVSEGSKFIWEFPVETRDVVVPFVIHDLPIPH